jgi:hypothetical protein
LLDIHNLVRPHELGIKGGIKAPSSGQVLKLRAPLVYMVFVNMRRVEDRDHKA